MEKYFSFLVFLKNKSFYFASYKIYWLYKILRFNNKYRKGRIITTVEIDPPQNKFSLKLEYNHPKKKFPCS